MLAMILMAIVVSLHQMPPAQIQFNTIQMFWMLERETDHRFLRVISVDFIWIGWGKSWEIWKWIRSPQKIGKGTSFFALFSGDWSGRRWQGYTQVGLADRTSRIWRIVFFESSTCRRWSAAVNLLQVPWWKYDKPSFFLFNFYCLIVSTFLVWSAWW